LKLNKDNARALVGLALIAAETYENKAGDLARRAPTSTK
jgi:hypothetical protein